MIVLLFLLCYFGGITAYTFVSFSLYSSMDPECDPEKHLVLNMKLNKQKNIEHLYAMDYFYLGDYNESIKYSEKMLESSNEEMVLTGLFNLARNRFFLGEYDLFYKMVNEYKSKLSDCSKLKPNKRVMYEKIQNVLEVMCVISKDDGEEIKNTPANIENWSNSKLSEGLINYLKGVLAYKTADKEEAIFRFKTVKETCSKTVLAKLSDEYLDLLKKYMLS